MELLSNTQRFRSAPLSWDQTKYGRVSIRTPSHIGLRAANVYLIREADFVRTLAGGVR